MDTLLRCLGGGDQRTYDERRSHTRVELMFEALGEDKAILLSGVPKVQASEVQGLTDSQTDGPTSAWDTALVEVLGVSYWDGQPKHRDNGSQAFVWARQREVNVSLQCAELEEKYKKLKKAHAELSHESVQCRSRLAILRKAVELFVFEIREYGLPAEDNLCGVELLEEALRASK